MATSGGDLKRDLKQSFSTNPVGSTVQLCPNRGDLRVTVIDVDGSLLSGATWRLWKTVGGASTEPDRTGALAGGKVVAKGLRPGVRCRLAWTSSDGGGDDEAPLDETPTGEWRRTIWLDCDQVEDDLEAARRRLTNLGYPEALAVEDMIALFQGDYGVETTADSRGTLDAATKARLTAVHDDGLPR